VDPKEVDQLIKSFHFLSVEGCVAFDAFKDTDAMNIGKAMNNCLKTELVQFLENRNVKVGKAKKEELMLKIFKLACGEKVS